MTFGTKTFRMSLFLTLVLTSSQFNEAKGAINYIDAFKSLKDSNVLAWPTPNSPRAYISSTFGPRIKASDSRYDFHRGVDIHGVVGDPVVASYDGVVQDITTYPSGGLTVILKHTFDEWVYLHPDKPNTKLWYTLYMHLDQAHVKIKTKGQPTVVRGGDLIGAVGTSGSSVTHPHLHHEIRVGTRCSLEYAVQNPTSTCNTKGYDPHVHPLLVYEHLLTSTGENPRPNLYVIQNLTGTNDGRIRIETEDVQPNINTYEIDVVVGGGGGGGGTTVKQTHKLDLNLRVGFNATSTEAIDTPDVTQPYLDPISFGYNADVWEIDFVIPSGWLTSKDVGDEFVLTVTDVWGTLSTLKFGDVNESW